MNQETLEMLMDKWMNEPIFRERMRTDPHTVIRETGVSLSQEELKELEQMDWSLSDEELQTRISKGTG